MEYWGPWSAMFRKTGGTISGNVNITGTLGVTGVTSLNTTNIAGLTTINDQLLIIWDDPIGFTPHIRLRDATAGGAVGQTGIETSGGGFKGSYLVNGANQLLLIPGLGGQVNMPDDTIEAQPLWKVPNLTQPLVARRMLMLHSLLFG